MATDPQATNVTPGDRHLALVAWTTSATILAALCLMHLGVMATFVTSHAVLPIVAPLALAAALLLGERLGRRQGLSGRLRLLPFGMTLILMALSVAVASWFYDVSWDGQWYHQVAVYRLAEGWNPLTDSMHGFDDDIQLWIRHYAKGPWYAGAAMTSLTGHVESGKFLTWPALVAAFLAVLAASLDAGMRRRRAVALAAVLALNPVTTTQMCAFMVDGLMISYLACYTAAVASALRRANLVVLLVGVSAAICCINSKATGLVFVCFIAAGAGLYSLARKAALVWRYAGLTLAAIGVGVFVFGFNPYVTNTLHRGHPFYPYQGTKAYPSLDQQGNEGIDLYETPKNLLGHNRVVRHAMALFGQPGVQPYTDGPNALPMWPFMPSLEKLVAYSTHEVRVAGFGPLFSGALLISVALTSWLMFRPEMPRGLILLSLAVIALSLLVSRHTWWARYGPQMYWMPLVPLAAGFRGARQRAQTRVAWALAGILMVNAFVVAAIHLNWEIQATRALRRQLTDIRASGREIEVDFQWFFEAAGRRFSDWGIPYHRLRREGANDGQELMTVVAGYPGAIHYRWRSAR